MRHVYGPVPSRRLGRSLGIDPVPFKTCNWNCVYCQLGRTTPMTGTRAEFIPAGEIVAEVAAALQGPASGQIDWLTFVSSGETTLHSGLGRMITEVKSLTPLPVAVLTNGSLLYREDVREELQAADAVLPTLDAGGVSMFKAVNRPLPEFTFERLVEGLMAFRREYAGKLWIEVMLVKGLNDTEESLTSLAAVLDRIAPDEVQINVPVRPPAEPWVKIPDERTLARASEILGEAVHALGPGDERFDFRNYDDIADAIVDVITRHPMRRQQLETTLAGWSRDEVAQALETLAASGRAQQVTRNGRQFWTSGGGRYGKRQ